MTLKTAFPEMANVTPQPTTYLDAGEMKSLLQYIKTTNVTATTTQAYVKAPEKIDYSKPTPSADRIEQGALEWVNEMRVRWGMEPLDRLPKGVRGNASNCVIARSFFAYTRVAGGVMAVNDREDVSYPPVVGDFIDRFDNGGYPHLSL